MGFRYYPDGVALFTSFGDQTLMKYDGRSLTLRYKALDMEAIHACSLVGFDCLHEKVLSGADINAVSEHGHSALHICCKDGKVAAVKVLIDNGAHLCCRDKDGNTALYYACIGGFEDIATLLIQSGADVHSVNKMNKSILWASMKGGAFNIVRTLVMNDLPYNPDGSEHAGYKGTWTELLHSSTGMSPEVVVRIVQEVLSQYPGLTYKLAHIRDPSGRTALSVAHPDVVAVFHNYLYIRGRYELVSGPPLHCSATAVLYIARDHGVMQEYEAMFRQHASYNKDMLDRTRFCECISRLGLLPASKMSEDALYAAFASCDINKNGAVDLGEFTKYCILTYGRYRKVVIKFINNEEMYHCETSVRESSDFHPTFIVPVQARLNETEVISALQHLRRNDDYLHSGAELLRGYHCALVMPAGDRSLEDIDRHERPSAAQVRVMLKDVARALQHMHDRGIVHGAVRGSHALRVNGRISLIDMSAAVFVASSANSNAAATTQDPNRCQQPVPSTVVGSKYSSGALPPEMFHRLTEEQEQLYFAHWRAEREANSELWRKIQPFCVLEEGTKVSYVVRTCIPASPPPSPQSGLRGLYTLPDDPVAASPAVDVWSFGVLLFELCSGQSLLRVNRDGDLCDAGEVIRLLSWVHSSAALHSEISSKVQDPIAAHLLCRLLEPNPEDRASMAEILGHPFFEGDHGAVRHHDDLSELCDQLPAHPGLVTETDGVASSTDTFGNTTTLPTTSGDNNGTTETPAFLPSAMSATDNVSLSANTVMQALLSAIQSRGDASHNAASSMIMHGSAQTFVTKTVGTEGALLRLARNICVEIPPHAMAPGSTKEVTVELVELIERYSKLTVVSPIMRIAPCNYQFRRPVFVTLPHCMHHGTKANVHIALFDSAYGVIRNSIDPNVVEYGDQYVRFPIAFASDVVVCFRDPAHARHISTDCAHVNQCQQDNCAVALTALRLNKRQCRYCDRAFCTEHCTNRLNNQFCCDDCFQHSWTMYLRAQCVASWANSDIILTMQPCFDRFDCSDEEKVLRCNFKNGVIKCSLQINLNEREFTLATLTNIHMSLKVPSVAVVMLNDATIEGQEPCEWRFNKYHEAPEMF